MIYADVQTAKILPTAPSLPTSESTDNILDSLQKFGTTTSVAVILGSYSILKPTAITENLLSYNSRRQQFNDVIGRASLPYIQKTVFAISPIQQKFYNTVNLQFTSTYFYSNNNASLQSIAVDFNDGQGYQIISTSGVSHTYTDSSGYKEIIFRGETSPGQYVYCKSLVDVDVDNATANRYIDTDPYAKVLLIKDLPGASGYNDFQDRLQIRYSVNNPTHTLAPSLQHLRKAIIYVEGYDVAGSDVKPNIIGPNGPTGLLGYNLKSLLNLDPNNPDKNGEWIKLWQNQNYDFMHDLDDVAGYDLVFVNYNTLRSVEANANMLQQVINWVNADKIPNAQNNNVIEKNVVIGESMGGLVARYCLASMTRASFNSTDTKLLITHDSPHQGANVPLGLQYFLYHLGYTKILGIKIKDNIGDINDFIEQNENAASTAQLLRARAVWNGSDVSTAFNTFLTAGGSYQTMVDLTQAQRPYRFVATAQGSQCGVPVSASNIVYAHQNASFGSLAFLSLSLQIRDKYYFIPGLGEKFKLETEIKSIPNQGVQQIESYKLTKKLSLLGVGLFNVFISNYTPENNPIGFNSWDNVPGSTESIEGKVGPLISSGPKKAISFPLNLIARIKAGLSLTVDNDLFSFVSTTSALDAPLGTDPFSIFNYGINGNANTRTDRYISQEFYAGVYNQNHTAYTPRNAKWMYEEMEDFSHTNGCLSDCPSNAAYTISGDDLICSTKSYTVTGLNSSLIVGGWLVTPQGIVNPITSGNTVTLTAFPGASGYITLSAAVQAIGCNAANPITKRIYVGKPQQVTTIMESEDVNSSCVISRKFSLKGIISGQTYTWFSACISPDPTPYFSQGTGTMKTLSQLNPCDDFAGQFKIRVDATNVCGTTTGTLEKIVDFNNTIEYDQSCLYPSTSNSDFYFITISPNPVTTSAIIKIKYLPPPNPPTPGPGTLMTKLLLYNSANQLVVSTTLSDESQYVLNTSFLTPGSYRLLVLSNSQQWLQATLIK